MSAMEVQESSSAPKATESVPTQVRGAPKSGRWWKEPKKPKNTINKVKPLHTKWDKKMEERAKKSAVKLLEKEIREKHDAVKQAKIFAKKAHIERREANTKKAEVVQVIRNTEKLKKMKKKQLRFIEKRDITANATKSD